MAKSTKPSGLSISRKNYRFTFSWKIPGDSKSKYESQTVQWKIGSKGSWQTFKNVKASTTEKQLSINPDSYNPTWVWGLYTTAGSDEHERKKEYIYPKIDKVCFRVRGKHKGDSESDWATKEYDVKVPDNPSVSNDLAAPDTTVFGWGVDTTSGSKKWLHHCDYQTILLKDCNIRRAKDIPDKEWSEDNIGWETGDTTANAFSGSKTITENTGNLPGWMTDTSYTRAIRYRAYGPQGASSKWVASKHVYAKPKAIKPLNASSDKENNGRVVTFKYDTTSSFDFPVDYVDVQYAIDTPETSSLKNPASSSWTDAPNSTGLEDTKNAGKAAFKIDAKPSTHQCLWVRANAYHDGAVTEGEALLVEKGVLEKPSSLTPDVNTSNWKANFTATNASEVPGTHLIIQMVTSSYPNGINIARIPNGQDTVTGVQLPNPGTDEYSFSAFAYVGGCTSATNDDGITTYTVAEDAWVSKKLTIGGQVPLAPTTVSANETSTPGTVRVTWDWPWRNANQAELSWADHEDAWESTNEPQTYIVNNINASAWNISGLSTGVTWYIRVRLAYTQGETTTYGAYSETMTVDLASAPSVPTLYLSSSVITTEGTVNASWSYTTNDGSFQSSAQVCEVTEVNGENHYIPLASTETAQHVELDARDLIKNHNWSAGTTHNLVLNVTSSSGKVSEWSEPVALTMAEPLVLSLNDISTTLGIVNVEHADATTYFERLTFSGEAYMYRQVTLSHRLYNGAESIVRAELHNQEDHGWVRVYQLVYGTDYTITVNGSTGLATITISNDFNLGENSLLRITYETGSEDDITWALKSMPFKVTVLGAGEGGSTSVSIVRNGSCHLQQPDETELDGYDQETIFTTTQNTSDAINITSDDLFGRFDDGEYYTLIATIQDNLGQTDSKSIDFQVIWDVKAVVPEASAIIDADSSMAILTPITPEEATEEQMGGATCDIYRLSVDKPELVYRGATFDETYIDPFPTIGEHGGYRFVFKTVNGDFMTEDNEWAWFDVYTQHESLYNIIDFGTDRVYLIYNVDLSSSWKKDFKETQYLGGSVQGDWNPAVSRTGNINSVVVTATDQDTVVALRRLAVYPGICHVRTLDGSSYSADVQVSESRGHEPSDLTISFTLNITRVDSEEPDGIALNDLT